MMTLAVEVTGIRVRHDGNSDAGAMVRSET